MKCEAVIQYGLRQGCECAKNAKHEIVLADGRRVSLCGNHMLGNQARKS